MSDAITDTLRRAPSQARAQARVERILEVATAEIVARGLDGVKMSEVAAEAGVSIGSLYQYFPNKAALVRQLMARYDAEGRGCVEDYLAAVRAPEDLSPALREIALGFFGMYRRNPAMRAIWQATQADASLQDADAAEEAALAELLVAALARAEPGGDAGRQRLCAALTMHQIASAVRFAITLPPAEGEAVMEMFVAGL